MQLFWEVKVNTKDPALTSRPPKDQKDLLPRLTFVKDSNMLGKDVYRFAGVYQFSEVTDKGRLFRRPLDARRRRRIPLKN